MKQNPENANYALGHSIKVWSAVVNPPKQQHPLPFPSSHIRASHTHCTPYFYSLTCPLLAQSSYSSLLHQPSVLNFSPSPYQALPSSIMHRSIRRKKNPILAMHLGNCPTQPAAAPLHAQCQIKQGRGAGQYL